MNEEKLRLLCLNATLKIFSIISWRSVLSVEITGVPGENRRELCIIACDHPFVFFNNISSVYFRRINILHYNGQDMFTNNICIVDNGSTLVNSFEN